MTAASELYLWFMKLPIRRRKEIQEDDTGEDSTEAGEKSGGGIIRTVNKVIENIELIKKMVINIVSYTLKHLIKIKDLMIRAEIGVDDAMQTALLYGAVSAAVYTAAGILDEHMRLTEHDIDLKADFNYPHIYAEIEAIISTNIFHLIVITAIAARYMLPLWLRNKKKEKNNG